MESNVVMIGGAEMDEIRPNFWVPKGTEVRDVGAYVEYWLDGKLMMAEPKQAEVR